jgi:hypothetical protein
MIMTLSASLSVGAVLAKNKFTSHSVPEGSTCSVAFKDETDPEVFSLRCFSNDVNPVGQPQ